MAEPATVNWGTRATPFLFVLLWSTGFIGAKYGLPYAEPLTFLALRMALVTAALAALAAVSPLPSLGGVRVAIHAVVAGLLVHATYLGAVYVAIDRGVPAGLTALIVGLQPLVTAVIVTALIGGEVGRRQWLGLMLGLGGIVMVLWQRIGPSDDPIGLAVAGLGLVGITAGTLYQQRFCATIDLRSATLIQYAASALVLGLLAALTERMAIDWTPDFVFALAWLCLVLSLGAVFLLFHLIRRGAATDVASLFYLVPPTVAAIAWLVFDERLTPLAIAGMALTAFGVALVRAPRRRAA